MQQNKVLCKPQGKVKTAQVSAQKLAAPGPITSHLCHSRPKPLAEWCSPVLWHSWNLPTQQGLHSHTLDSGQGPTCWKKRTPHAPTSGQPYLWREESLLETLMSSPAPSSTRPESCSRSGVEPVQESQRSSSPSSPTPAAGPASTWYGCCWEKMLLHSLVASSSGLLLGACSHREGKWLPWAGQSQQSGNGLLFLCRAQDCKQPSCSFGKGSTPCL